jgi:hypothetical protein
LRDFQRGLHDTADQLNFTVQSARRAEAEQTRLRQQEELERKAASLSIPQIIGACQLVGVRLERDSDVSVVARPKDRLTGELREIVKLRRDDLIAYLKELATSENL